MGYRKPYVLPRMVAYDSNNIPEWLHLIRDALLAKLHKSTGTPAYGTERRARRFGFVATAEVTDLQLGQELQERTTDLSLYGCCVAVSAKSPFAAGTRVRVRIINNVEKFEAIGRVAYANSDGDMGIAFMRIAEQDKLVLERWIVEVRDAE